MKKLQRSIKPPLGPMWVYVAEEERDEKIKKATDKIKVAFALERKEKLSEFISICLKEHRLIFDKHFEEYNKIIKYLEGEGIIEDVVERQ